MGVLSDEVMTRADGIIPASDTNIVDGLPVYNACVVIKGSYSSRPDAQKYKGQFPKVLVEGHIDVVNPEELPKSGDPSIHIKLQPYAQPVVATPEELAAIPDELSFDARRPRRRERQVRHGQQGLRQREGSRSRRRRAHLRARLRRHDAEHVKRLRARGRDEEAQHQAGLRHLDLRHRR